MIAEEARPRALQFTNTEKQHLAAMYGSVAALAVLAWGLFLHYQHHFGAEYAAGGSLAFGFGIRHAFDADHICAIDDTTRYLLQRGKRRLGVGYFFALGHSTVVIALALTISVAAEDLQKHIPDLQRDGAVIGAIVSGGFLFLIAILDLFILVGLLDAWKKAKAGSYSQQELDDLMMQRGFINRIMGSRWRKFISDSWQMYPVGFLFGLGFDTASQIGMVALTAAAATGHLGNRPSGAPIGAVLALPLLFTAGMTFVDCTDGVVMAQAYNWAFLNPIRKVYYNISTVALGVFVAVGVGSIEVLQVVSVNARWTGGFWRFLNQLDFEVLGYGIVGAFVVLWVGAVLSYRLFHFEERYGAAATAPAE